MLETRKNESTQNWRKYQDSEDSVSNQIDRRISKVTDAYMDSLPPTYCKIFNQSTCKSSLRNKPKK